MAREAVEGLDPAAGAIAPRDSDTERGGPGRIRIRSSVRAIFAVRGPPNGRAAMRHLPCLQLVFAGQSPGLSAGRAREHGARIPRGGRRTRQEAQRTDPHRAGARARRLPRGRNASGGSADHPGLSCRSNEREYAKRVAETPRGASACHSFSSRHHAARALARDGAKPLPEVCVAVPAVGAGAALAEGAGLEATRGDTGGRRRCSACRAQSCRHGRRSPALHRESWKFRLRSHRSRRNGCARSAVGPGWMAAAMELRSVARPSRGSGTVWPVPGTSDFRYGTSLRRCGYRRLPAPAGASPGARATPAQRQALCRGPPASVSAARRPAVNGKTGPASPATAGFPGLVDSHCHLDFPEFDGKMDEVRKEMRTNGVTHALCISVNLAGFPKVLALAEAYDNFFATVGVHPDHEDRTEVDPARVVELARHPRVVAIGETGLDYFRLSGDLEWQRERFRAHIRAARECGKPLVIHTRHAAEDTLAIMREEGAAEVGGVMHCFTESRATAEAAIALGFHISFSGIVTFKNAGALKDVARWVPVERLLVETDSPYLAPVPHRGETNRPALVRRVGEEVARLRSIPFGELAAATTSNFFRLFGAAKTS